MCVDCNRQWVKGFRFINPEKSLEFSREWRKKNIEIHRERSRKYYEKHPEKAREWRAANREKSRAIVRNRNAKRRNAKGAHTADDIDKIRKYQKDRCAMPDCRTELNGGGHVDHIVALSKGGSNAASNLQLLCAHCNISKSARDPIEFAQSRGLLI
jgi:5-methylcytosine-specific restriction endonuclease McrA